MRMGIPGVNPQVSREHIEGNRTSLLLIAVVVAITLVLYGLYGGLTRIYGASVEAVATEALSLPTEYMVYQPEWSLLTPHPSQGIADIGEQRRRYYWWRSKPDRLAGQAVNVETKSGYRMLWGLESLPANEFDGLTIVSGSWPQDAEELLVDADTNLEPGELTTVQYLHPFTQRTTTLKLRVSGVYSASWSMELPLITDATATAQLLGTGKKNLLFVDNARHFAEQYHEEAADYVSRVPVLPTEPPPGKQEPRWLRSLGGRALFDISLVGPKLITNDTVSGDEADVRYRIGFALVPVMMTVLSVVIAILTLVIVNIFIGQQRTIGIWRALGVAEKEIRQLYLTSILGAGIVGSIGGLLIYAPLVWSLNQYLEQPLPVPWSSALLWAGVLLLLGGWASHVAGRLYTASPIRSYLNSETNIDWWALLRFTIDMSSEEEGRI
jgi:hypothetical protein